MYHENNIIIVGLVTLKKTNKAPERYKIEAMTNIEKYIRSKVYKKSKN